MAHERGWGRAKAGLIGAVVAAVLMLCLPVVAAVGGNLILGKPNSADAVTSLSGASAASLRITNTEPGGTALDLRVTSGAAPLKVNSTVRVANLNGDRLDGKHASAFLLTTGTAADSSLLDGLDSTAFSLAGHGHGAADITSGSLAESRFSAYSDLGSEGYLNNDSAGDLLTRSQLDSRFLGLAGTAADSSLLDGLDSTAFSLAGHGHGAADITSGSLAESRFSAYSDLGSEGYLSNDSAGDLLTRSQSDARYLGLTGVAADSSQLDGRASGAYQGVVCPPGETLTGYDRSGPVCSSFMGAVTLDNGGDAGTWTSLVLDASGYPVVSYYDVSNGDLKLVRCGDATCSAGNVIRTLDGTGDVGWTTSLVLDAFGYPVISYFDYTNWDLKVVRCGDATCSAGNVIRAVDTAGDLGWTTSLVLDASGYPVISYYTTTSGDLKLVHCGDATCSTGNVIRTVDGAATTVGGHSSLVLDRWGNPVISYYDNLVSNGDLKLVHCGDATCSAGNVIRTLDSAGDVGEWTSLALDAAGNPVIGYFDTTNGMVKVVRCGDATCSAGNTFRSLDNAGNVPISLVLDATGNPVISYYEPAGQDLAVARCWDPTCAGFTRILVDVAGDVGKHASLALDASGHPVVAYYDTTNSSLKLAMAVG